MLRSVLRLRFWKQAKSKETPRHLLRRRNPVTVASPGYHMYMSTEKSKGKAPSTTPPVPPPQGLCCMSGCQNCVWLKYVDEMMAYYKDNKEQARMALDQVPDESLKAFLRIELGL